MRRDFAEDRASGAERKPRRESTAPTPSLALHDRLGNSGVLRLMRAAHAQNRSQAAAGSGEGSRAALEHQADEAAARVSGVASPRSRSVPLADPPALAGGSPLAVPTRTHMETALGHDFGDVRIHTGHQANAAARSLGAVAFTRGSDLAFRDGAYAPHTPQGRNLLAHELSHVVQQRTRSDAPRAQARVVDDDAHLPCRTTTGKNARAGQITAAAMQTIENDAAALATGAATVLRANPVGELTRELLWKWFRLDYNNPRVRCRKVRAIAERYEAVASGIKNTDMKYPCPLPGAAEPDSMCGTKADAVTTAGKHIALCSTFFGAGEAPLLLHEWIHFLFAQWRGALDEPTGGFDTAACYATFAVDIASGNIWDTLPLVQCPPNPDPLPKRNNRWIDQGCPSNVFTSLTLGGLYTHNLFGDSRVGATLGFNVEFPLTTMHDWDFTVGPRFGLAKPVGETERDVFLMGLRLGPTFRKQPWRFGWDVGGYIEPGVMNLGEERGFGPDVQKDSWHPYVGVGGIFGLNWATALDSAFRLSLDLGGGVVRDSRDAALRDDKYVPYLQVGIMLGFEGR